MAKIVVESGKTYLGVVEDNNDPKKAGRCRIRVMDVFDGKDNNNEYQIKKEDLPWAFPWKDLNGNAFNVPDIGKIVIVVFENGNQNTPEYISSDHYNVNLEKKLESLSKEDYLTMKALIFDHKTQIYVNDSEGLKLDHKFNNINIKDQSINVNLKDNFGKVNLGTENATQRAILGDTFTNWLDELLGIFMSGAFLGNFGANVVPTPKLIKHIQLYKAIKDPKILSKNVYIVDNEDVKKLDRIADGTLGDNWQSTIEENTLTKTEEVTYKSVDGSSDTTFEQPKENSALAGTSSVATPSKLEPVVKEINPDIKILLEVIKTKNYTLYSKPYELNIVGVRNQCLSINEKYTDEFVDKLYVMFKDENDEWVLKKYIFSTMSGSEFTLTQSFIENRNLTTYVELESYINKRITMKEFYNIIKDDNNPGIQTLVPSQYLGVYQIGSKMGGNALITKQNSKQMVWIDSEFKRPEYLPANLSKPIKENKLGTGDFGIAIQNGFPGGKKVGNWSVDGSQTLSTKEDSTEFFDLCNKHKEKNGDSFTYTLVTKKDWDSAIANVEANKGDANSTTDPQKEKAPVVLSDKPQDKPKELANKTDILSFQVYSNKKSVNVTSDGAWGENTKNAWNKLKTNYLKQIGFVKDSDLRLLMARLFPYGSVTKNTDSTFTFTSPFNNEKWTINAFENKRFFIFDKYGTVLSKGNYDDGCLKLTVTEGKYVGKTFKDDNAWDNVRKLVS
jgi:hypothetical protein